MYAGGSRGIIPNRASLLTASLRPRPLLPAQAFDLGGDIGIQGDRPAHAYILAS